jgi:hypothetical protein
MWYLIGHPWVAPTLSQCHLWSIVGCHSTQQLSKLLRLWDPHKSRMHQYTTQSCSPGSDDWSTIDTGRGYHLWSSKNKNRPLSTFPSGILHFLLVALPGLDKATNRSLTKTTYNHHREKEPYRRWLSTTRLLRVTYFTKHSHSIVLNPSWG